MTILIAYSTKDSCWFASDGLVTSDGPIYSKNTCKIVLPDDANFNCVFGVAGSLDVLSILKIKSKEFSSITNVGDFTDCLHEYVSDSCAIRQYEGFKGFNVLLSFRDNPSLIYDIDESSSNVTTYRGFSITGSGRPYVQGAISYMKKHPQGYKNIRKVIFDLLDTAKESDVYCGGSSFIFRMSKDNVTNAICG